MGREKLIEEWIDYLKNWKDDYDEVAEMIVSTIKEAKDEGRQEMAQEIFEEIERLKTIL